MKNEIDQALEAEIAAEIAKALEPCKRVLSEGIKSITDTFKPRPKAEPQERKTS